MATRKSGLILAIVGLFSSAISFGQNLEASCRAIIESGLRNLSVNNQSVTSLQTIYRRHCETNGSVRSSSLGLGLDAVVDAIPVGFTGNFKSSKEAMQNFCKSYSGNFALNIQQNSREETIVERAYDSFDQCIAMAANGIIVRHDVRDFNTFDFFVAPGYNRVMLNGVQVPKQVTCQGQDPTKAAGQVVNFGIATKIVLTGEQTLNITCSRTGTADAKGVIEYPEATVTLLTNVKPAGNYSAYLPPDAKLPRDIATEMQASLLQLSDKQKALEATVDVAKKNLLSGRTVVGGLNGNHPPYWVTKTIPFIDEAGQPITFPVVPRVVAVPEKNAAQGGVSWATTVEAVTKTNFTVRVIQVGRSVEPNHGWSGAAAVAWIADARE